jgi:hypothetical protein
MVHSYNYASHLKAKAMATATQEKHIRIGSDLPMHRMGFDAMRIGGECLGRSVGNCFS